MYIFEKNKRIIGTMFCPGNYKDFIEEIDFAKAQGADMIEIRFDTEEKIHEPNATYYGEGLEAISTCMRTDEGGYFTGSLDDWAMLLTIAVNCGTEYISISLKQAGTKQGKKLIAYARAHKVKIIISVHIKNMPSERKIVGILKEIELVGADVAKIACEAVFHDDVLKIMKASLHGLSIPKIIIAIGESGKFWRAVSLIPPWNCWGMFAYIKKPTGKGQLSVKELKKILDILK